MNSNQVTAATSTCRTCGRMWKQWIQEQKTKFEPYRFRVCAHCAAKRAYVELRQRIAR